MVPSTSGSQSSTAQPPRTPSPSRRPPPQTPPLAGRARTPSTLLRAANTALPTSPPTQTPPSAWDKFGAPQTPPTRRPGRKLESPFDDRHSIVRADGQASVAADPFEYMAPSRATAEPRSEVARPVSALRRSIYPPASFIIPASTLEEHADLVDEPPRVAPPPTPVKPSFYRLFTLASVRHRLLYLLPALIFSVLAALVAPYMTLVIGSAFTAFESYPIDPRTATDEQKRALISSVSSTSLKLTIAGICALVFNYLKSVTWIRFSEVTATRLREIVYRGVQDKPMEWFDMGMGMQETAASDTVGAGGLMARFTRCVLSPSSADSSESDEVRIATAIACGSTIQYLVSFVVCFILAMVKQPVLAVVTLSSVPLMIIVNIATQVFGEPMYKIERRAFAEASTNVERATAAIATVKAHNAQAAELDRFRAPVERARASLLRQANLWAWCISLSDFFLFAIFVVGFWYGAKVVHDGSSSVGNVMTVFWACMLASSFLQSAVPQMTVITKGKTSLASLLTIIQTPAFPAAPQRSSLRRIRPAKCHGEFTLRNVTFAYPSRPSVSVLDDVSLFLPAREMTFIVGGSGSGKSTVAQLLLRLYSGSGSITMDDQSLAFLDEDFTKEHIAAVQQSCILFDSSVHENVAMGLAGAPGTRRPADVTRAEVVDACKMAYIHEFIESLPLGYDTKLGTGGSQLSGGQKQRLALARARIRDPTVLILDEATSALDATSRVVVFQAVKRWRTNKTTIVITHDLSQVSPDDFVYVMANGAVAEQGFRSDLVGKSVDGVFAMMAAEQAIDPVPLKEDDEDAPPDVEEILETVRPRTPSFALRPASVMYLDILDEYSRDDHRFSTPVRASARLSWSPAELNNSKREGTASRPASRAERPPSRVERPPSRVESSLSRRSTRYTVYDEKVVYDDIEGSVETLEIVATKPTAIPLPSIFASFAYWFKTIPHKSFLFFGILGAIGHGVATPVWSSYVAKLMAIVGSGGSDNDVTRYGVICLAVCVGQAFADWCQEYFLYRVAAEWTASVRIIAFERAMRQDKGWFDESDHSPARLVQVLIKDAEDMRTLMSIIIGRACVFVTMVGLGLIWAMVIGWRLTLVGLAIGPVFGIIVMFSERVTNNAEIRNKQKREAVAKTFYEAVANVRGIRSMALDKTFREMYERQLMEAQRTGQTGAWATSISTGATAAVPLFAQALMNWVGAIFMEKSYLNYEAMLEVYTLVLFSLTFGVQMLNFLPMMAKARVASRDFDRVYGMAMQPREAEGALRFPITGNIVFDRVAFSYPTRPDVPVLSDLSFSLVPGECVAIVGPSGCGKSTVAALLQRLYEPTAGTIRMDRFHLSDADVHWIRNHTAVVSQSANLFDASVAANIAYGAQVPLGEIYRAAQAANIHEFIQGLPQGYDTMLGENASLISGGQAQRLQIARALVRRSNILILDECTSALDVDNARAVLDTIVKVKESRTTLFITHSVDAMKRCDRILCLDNGRIAEDGTFDELVRKGGVFAQLMQTGEWE